MAEPDIADIKRRMEGAVSVLDEEFGGLRTGRASVSLLDRIVVNAYGSEMPLNQVATVSVPEARLLVVNVWDRGNVQAVERAIRESDLGLNPATEGQVLRVPIPELSAERREELVKVAHRYAEQARVSVRNVRRDGMDKLKRMEKEGDISEDEHRAWGDEIQEMTDEYIKRIDTSLADKEDEVRQI
ncbi:MAG TPA: ribosome recycling factor [Alphaproteobacteria bacterium]|nr:ribosome recycling factor [Alphaproteobacteria bacterium]